MGNRGGRDRVCGQQSDGAGGQVSEPFAFLAACALGLSLLVIDTAARVTPHQTLMIHADPCLVRFSPVCDVMPAAFERR